MTKHRKHTRMSGAGLAALRWFGTRSVPGILLALLGLVRPAAAAPGHLFIADFQPKQGGPGTVIDIVGGGFGNNPDNLCAIIMNGDLALPLEVLAANDVTMQVRLGVITPEARPGPLMVALGTGQRGFAKYMFVDMSQREPNWVWVRRPGGPEASSLENFTPLPNPQQPASGAAANPPAGRGSARGLSQREQHARPHQTASSPAVPAAAVQTNAQRWFFSGAPTEGVICLYLEGDWPQPSRIQVQARAHDHQRGIGRDLTAYSIEFPAGGTLQECVWRVCDTIRCAFMQQGNITVNCRVDPVPGSNSVKITLSMPDGRIGWGNLNVCVEPAPPPPPPVIVAVDPPFGCTDDILTITGQGFGRNPDDLCAVIMLQDNRSIPLRVLEANDSYVRAEVGAVPEDLPAGTTGQIMVGLGNGRVGTFRPAFFDVFLRAPVWAWNKAGPDALAPIPFVPCPRPAPPRQWFFSGPPTADGRLCLLLDKPWPVPSRLRIEARAHDHQRRIGRDLRALCVDFGALTNLPPTQPPGIRECALRICEVVVAGFRELAGLDVNCTVEGVPGTPFARIYLSLPDGVVNWGNLNVCVEPIPQPLPPVITQVEPSAGRPGEVIKIRGANFGWEPDNLCVIVMNGERAIPMQAIRATDTEICAVLGEVAPDAQPGPIMVGIGLGGHGRFRPAFFDVFVADDVWTWDRRGGPMGESPQVFTPIPRQQTITGPQWFFSGPPVDGRICLTLSNLWPTPAKVSVQARAHSHQKGVGRDLSAVHIEFPGAGTLLDCALRICDVVRCAFMQQAGLTAECTVEAQPDGTVRVYLGLAEGPVDWGNLNVCVEPGTQKPPPPVITGITPVQGGEGTILTITGNNFPTDPNDLCAIVMSGNESVPLEVIDATPTLVRARLGPVSPTAVAGPVMLAPGVGHVGRFVPQMPGTELCEPVWVWTRNGGPEAAGPLPFRPVPNPTNPTNIWFWSGPPTNGVLQVTLQANWPSNTVVRIEARAHDHQRGIGHDLRAVCVRFPNGGTLLECARRICDAVVQAFLQQAGIVVNCQVVQITPGQQVRLVLTLPNGNVDWGNCNICVQSVPPAPGPVITAVIPTGGPPGTLITVRGTGFPTDPDNVCMILMDDDISVPVDVLTATRTQLVARLGPVDPTRPPRPLPIMIGIGNGQRITPTFMFPDLVAAQPVWTWEKDGAEAEGPPFMPQPVPPPPQQRWFFSGPPTNGVICLYLDGDWPAPAKLTVQARAHDHQRGIGRDLQAIDIRLPGGGSLLECALRICDVIRCAFLQATGHELSCAVQQVTDATGLPRVKITLSLPDGRIGWGNLNVCVEPAPQPPPPIITAVTPLTGGEGTIIRVRGTNFPTDPDDICMIVMSGELAVPIEVLTATPTDITGRLGAVDPTAQPGPIMIAAGEGQRGTFRPAFFDIFVEEPVWVWRRTGAEADSPVLFAPLPTNPPPPRVWFWSGPPQDGKLCVTLSGNWPPGTRIRIEARAHDHAQGIGRDLRAISIGLPNGGTLLDCAKRICDVIRCAFGQQAGIMVNCTATLIVDPTGNEAVKLTLTLPEGYITWGNFNVCVEAPQPQPVPVTIAGFTPAQGGEDDIITITGTGFGNNPDNLCVIVMNGPASIPLEVLEATDTQLRARLGAVPPDAQPGPVMVGRGQGTQGRFRPAFFDVFVADDVWTWDRRNGPMAETLALFRPIPRPPPPYTRWFFGQPPADGVLCLFLMGGWPDPSEVRIEARLHDHTTGIGHDLRAINVRWGSYAVVGTDGLLRTFPMTLLGCAERICDVIACAFWQQAGIMVTCEIIPINNQTMKLVLRLPNGHVDWGNFNVCVRPLRGDPGPVLDAAPIRVAGANVPALRLGWPLTRTGFELEGVPVLVDGTFDGIGRPDGSRWQPEPVALQAVGTQLRTVLPAGEPQRYFRLHKLPPVLQPLE